jgi:hypothetical protein
MDKLLFQQLLTVLCFFGCGFLIAIQPDHADRWFGFASTLIAYWLPSPSRENKSP